jgi:hypothetical protein
MFNAIPLKISMTFFIGMKKSIIKLIWKHKGPCITKAIPSRKNNAGGIARPAFKLHYRTIVIKMAWYWHKNRHEEEWNRTDNLDTDQCSYNHLIIDK